MQCSRVSPGRLSRRSLSSCAGGTFGSDFGLLTASTDSWPTYPCPYTCCILGSTGSDSQEQRHSPQRAQRTRRETSVSLCALCGECPCKVRSPYRNASLLTT